MKTNVVIIGAGPAGIFTALEMLKKEHEEKDRHLRKGRADRKAQLPEGEDEEVHELPPVLPYHNRLFRRGRVFGWQALA